MSKKKVRRCLIVERHPWETGGAQQQLQFVLADARKFFGTDSVSRQIQIQLFIPANAESPATTKSITISKRYSNGTRRTNGFAEMGGFPPGFVFFEETGTPNEYDVWWQSDAAIVAARYKKWSQGLNTQHRRGRLSMIVEAPVPRLINRID